MSYDDFLLNGKSQLAEDLHRQISYEIAQQAIEAELILIGYAQLGWLIFEFANSEVEQRRDFSAIGSGRWIAEATLFQREQQNMRSLAETVYAVYEAKRLGQIAPGVGSETTIMVLRYSNGITNDLASRKDKRFLEKQFRRLGPRKINKVELAPDLKAYEADHELSLTSPEHPDYLSRAITSATDQT